MRIQILILGFKGLTGINRPFYRYGSHIELLRFKEYYVLPMRHEHHPLYALSIRNMVFTFNFSGKRRSLLYILTRHNDLFSHYNLQSNYSKKNLRKMPQKALVNSKQDVLMPPGHPIILLNSNIFNVAAVSVKRCIKQS